MLNLIQKLIEKSKETIQRLDLSKNENVFGNQSEATKE